MTIKLNDDKDLNKLKAIVVKAVKRGIDGGRNCINWNATTGTEAKCALAVEDFSNEFIRLMNVSCTACKGDIPLSSSELIDIAEQHCTAFIANYFPNREWKREEERKVIRKILKNEISVWVKDIKQIQRNEKISIKKAKADKKKEIKILKDKLKELRSKNV